MNQGAVFWWGERGFSHAGGGAEHLRFSHRNRFELRRKIAPTKMSHRKDGTF